MFTHSWIKLDAITLTRQLHIQNISSSPKLMMIGASYRLLFSLRPNDTTIRFSLYKCHYFSYDKSVKNIK